MKFFFTLLSILAISLEAYAWGGYTHQLLAEESLKPFFKSWGLDQPITITPFSQFLEKFSKEHPSIQTREDFARWLQINPDSPFDKPSRNQEKIFSASTPFKTLALYAPRADDGRDKQLPYDRLEQFWFGSGTSTASQAFRHLEKPPFNLFSPLNTFGFPLGSVGQASQRAQIYFDLAIEAHRLGEPYWGWNFLGVGLHYIEDLQNPYHAAQLILPLAIEGFKSYLLWGMKENWGLIKTVTHVTSNLHHYFEGYVDITLRNGPDHPWRRALQEVDGEDKRPLQVSQLAKRIRDFSNQSVHETVLATLDLTKDRLLGEREYDIGSDLNPYPEPLDLFFNPNEDKRDKARLRLDSVVMKSFRFQGNMIRTYVGSYIMRIR